MKHLIICAVLFLLLVSCASYNKLTTPSGKPEIFISNVSQQEIFTTILNDITSKGYSVETLDEYFFLSFIKNDENVFRQWLIGGYVVETKKVKFNLITQDNGVKIYASLQGTHGGRYLDHSKGRGGSMIQEYLEELKVKLNK